MPPRMRRGKQQILLNHLPGKTFDFDRIGVIARVDRVRGTPRTDLNGELILNAVNEYASAWNEASVPLCGTTSFRNPVGLSYSTLPKSRRSCSHPCFGVSSPVVAAS